jgi:hypothetical protein
MESDKNQRRESDDKVQAYNPETAGKGGSCGFVDFGGKHSVIYAVSYKSSRVDGYWGKFLTGKLCIYHGRYRNLNK